MTVVQSRQPIAHSAEWERRVLEWESAIPERRDLCARIAELKVVVTRDLSHFRDVFPEFTPHDVSLHAARMMRISDAILKDNLANLTVDEYLVFLTAVYAHDWGMSVAAEEKAVIMRGIAAGPNALNEATGQVPSPCLLPDEAGQLISHLHSKYDEPASGWAILLNDDSLWADYVRETHAQRSGARVREFFRGVHARFGDYAGLVAEGHTAGKERIADRTAYMGNAAGVLDDTSSINIQALAVYLRLVDLFDLSDERTPHSLWRVVSPRAKESVVEWQKHMSLAPVHLDSQAESLQFQGEVRNADAWAAVNDLKSYCQEEFGFSQSLLSKYSGARYHLGFHWLDWDNVRPKGICSEVVRFGFDRDTVFAVLSEEVYERDPYVFIRELLQNAVDAVKTREMCLRKMGASFPRYCPIVVESSSRPEGDYKVTVRDEGIGMDTLVIEQYLAVVGKSFYRSADFRKLGIKYDAISRFGVGILSCFMVADAVEIETTPDPSVLRDGQPLSIHIGSANHHWTIRESPPGNHAIGTTVTVRVSASKIAALQRDLPENVLKEMNVSRTQLDVTRYLKVVAGFVELPILVHEGSTKTAILHPDCEDSILPESVRRDYQIHKLPMEYSFANAVTPASVEPARSFFRVETLRLKEDLGLVGAEGAISFPVPRDPSCHITLSSAGMLASKYGITFYTHVSDFTNRRFMSLSESCARDQRVACFCDGIFVADVKYPPQLSTQHARPPQSRCGTWALNGVQLFVNIRHRQLNAARSHLAGMSASWADAIFEAVGKQFAKRWRDELLLATPVERLRLLARYGQYYPVSLFEVADTIGVENWPVCILKPGGHLNVVPWGEVASDQVATVPELLREMCSAEAERFLHGEDKVDVASMKEWGGAPMIAGLWSNWIGCTHYDTLTRMPLVRLRYGSEVRWINPPLPFLPPIEQDVWIRQQGQAQSVDAGDPASIRLSPAGEMLTRQQMSAVARGLCQFDCVDDGRYPRAFDSYCFWGQRLVNAKHVLGASLLRVLLLLEELRRAKTITPELDDRLMQWFRDFFSSRPGYITSDGVVFHVLDGALDAMATMVRPYDLRLAEKLAAYETSLGDFLPGSFQQEDHGKPFHVAYGHHYERGALLLPNILLLPAVGEWGQLLAGDSPWPSWKDMRVSNPGGNE